MRSEEFRPFIELALSNILSESVDDVLERPFELDSLFEREDDKDKLIQFVEQKLIHWVSQHDDRSAGEISHIYFPKNSSGLRKCAYIDISDAVFYLSLVLTVAENIESYRIPAKDHVVFSYRYNVNGSSLFDGTYNYTAYRVETGIRLRKECVKYLVKTDIENFYDRANIHRIESQLFASLADKDCVKGINELLLHWSNRDSYGLPVGNNASRILAEVALADIDKHLLKEGVEFIRFVDDYRFFAPDVATAYRWIELLAERLSQDGLQLNAYKTTIRPKIEAMNEFKAIVSRSNEAESNDQKVGKAAPFTQYSGLFPRKFRKLSDRSRAEFAKKDLEAMFAELPDQALVMPEKFTDLVKTIFAKEAWDSLTSVAELSLQLPRFLPYVCDFFLKIGDEVDEVVRRQVAETYSAWFLRDDVASMEYALYSISLLMGSRLYDTHEAIVSVYLKRQSTLSPALGRQLLASMSETITRSSYIRIKRIVRRMTYPEKRQFLELGKKALHHDELRPVAKVLKFVDAGDPVSRLQVAALNRGRSSRR